MAFPLFATLSAVSFVLFLLVHLCEGDQAMHDILLVGVKNTSTGVNVTVVPDRNSRLVGVSCTVQGHYVPSQCSRRTVGAWSRCGEPVVLAVNLSAVSTQRVVLAQLTGALLIVDLRHTEGEMSVKCYPKAVPNNDCDPVAVFPSTNVGMMNMYRYYFVCEGKGMIFMYIINLNTENIFNSTIPDYQSSYDLWSQLSLVSNYVGNGLGQVYLMNQNCLEYFDVLVNSFVNPNRCFTMCNAPYHLSPGTEQSSLFATCEDSNGFTFIDLLNQDTNSIVGLVYPCLENHGVYFIVHTQASGGITVETSGLNQFSISVDRVIFQSAVCVSEVNYLLLAVIGINSTNGLFQILVFSKGSPDWVLLKSGLDCSKPCGLTLSEGYLLTYGGTSLVFAIRNGSILPQPLIENQFSLELQVLIAVPYMNTNISIGCPTEIYTPPSSKCSFSANTSIPTTITENTAQIKTILLSSIIPTIVGLAALAAVMISCFVWRKCKNRGQRTPVAGNVVQSPVCVPAPESRAVELKHLNLTDQDQNPDISGCQFNNQSDENTYQINTSSIDQSSNLNSTSMVASQTMVTITSHDLVNHCQSLPEERTNNHLEAAMQISQAHMI